MSYKLQVTQKLGYLHAVVTGDNTRANVLGYIADLRAECAARKCWYVLLEEHLTGPRLKLRDVLNIVFSIRLRGVGRLPSVAFVNPDASGFLVRLAEAIATVRGLQFLVFESVAEAEQWLRKVG